jgi:hypothetical protein
VVSLKAGPNPIISVAFNVHGGLATGDTMGLTRIWELSSSLRTEEMRDGRELDRMASAHVCQD